MRRKRRDNEDLIRVMKRKGALTSARVEDAIRNNPREIFVDGFDVHKIYSDIPLPTARGQTISQPSVVALMTEWLEPEKGDRILEIGTGSGWQAAILASLVGPQGAVYTVERMENLAERARENLLQAGREEVEVVVGDGSTGLSEYAPFDRLICTAAAPGIPAEWRRQLVEGGRLVAPVGDTAGQAMVIYEKFGEKLEEIKREFGYRFVPLKGEKGQGSDFCL